MRAAGVRPGWPLRCLFCCSLLQPGKELAGAPEFAASPLGVVLAAKMQGSFKSLNASITLIMPSLKESILKPTTALYPHSSSTKNPTQGTAKYRQPHQLPTVFDKCLSHRAAVKHTSGQPVPPLRRIQCKHNARTNSSLKLSPNIVSAQTQTIAILRATAAYFRSKTRHPSSIRIVRSICGPLNMRNVQGRFAAECCFVVHLEKCGFVPPQG